VIGYASLRYGTTGLESAYDDLLTGRADPNPLRDVFDDILGRQPEPKDLTLTIDKRLQDFAARQLAGTAGAIVAIDPRTGAILAMTSSPTFNATPISGDPNTATAPRGASPTGRTARPPPGASVTNSVARNTPIARSASQVRGHRAHGPDHLRGVDGVVREFTIARCP